LIEYKIVDKMQAYGKVPENNNVAEIYNFCKCGGPKFGANSVLKDRILPNPSPSANLAGMWKAFDRLRETAAMPAVFLFLFFCFP
jgi:hypothetical protein